MPIDTHSKPLKCLVSTNGANRVDVAPTLVPGAQVVPTKELEYNGHKVSATFLMGDQYESQQVLSLNVGDAYGSVYDPTDGSLYRAGLSDGTDLQCWFD